MAITEVEVGLDERYQAYIDRLREDEPWLTGRQGQLDLVRIGVDVPVGEYRLVNAPTATGKSLAALMIAGERALKGERTVIATFTRLLQNQYRDKDFVKAVKLFPEVEFAILKGANNYFCKDAAKHGLSKISSAKARGIVQEILDAEGEPCPETGGEPPLSLPEFVHQFITADSSECRDHEPKDCGYAAAKARAAKAKVVITNHMMVMVNGMLPQILARHSLLIVDEIHNFPKAAESWGTKKLSRNRLINLLTRNARHFEQEKYAQAIEALNELFMQIPIEKEERFVSIKELKAMIPWFRMLESTMPVMPDGEFNAFESDGFNVLKSWIGNAVAHIQKKTDSLYQLPTVEGLPWGSNRRPVPGEARLLLHTVDISKGARYALRTSFRGSKEESIYERAVLMMSATTGTASKPAFVAERCGLKPEEVELVKLKSPLNYQDQMRVSSVRVTGEWTKAVGSLVNEMGGRSLVLCGSWAKVNDVTARLEEEDWTVYVQAKNDPTATSAVVEAFRKHEKSVLVGTASLYEGIDIQGSSLSQVIIKDLPMVPGVMTLVGRERRRRLGDKWMSDMQIPYIATVLEQMAGRLIRSEGDLGLVVILDDKAQLGWGKAAVHEAMSTFGDVIVPRSQALTWLVPF